jgi:16S rRNA (cytosine1402-N4)-methyltransferase
MQLDQAERGFSFRFDGPLDMRMDAKSGERTAADIVNKAKQDELANIIYLYGEERHSRRIASKIVQMRAEKPFARTQELADAVRSVVHKKPQDKIDPATRTFQALRIAVNDELGELERALKAAEHILARGGRLVVVSFHSLEDSLVKDFMKEVSQAKGQGSRYRPEVVQAPALFEMLSRKAVKPSEKEIEENPRSRSARLRSAVRLAGGGA